jgi:hypothetical protein
MIARALFWGLAGVGIAVPLDALHVVTGVLSYTTPRAWMPFGLQDWFVFPLFIGAGLAMGLGHRHIATRLSNTPVVPSTTPVAAALGTLALVVSYASSGFFERAGVAPAIVLALYVGMFLAALALVAKSARKLLVFHAVGTALISPGVEAALSSAGAFHYHRPDVAGVALWLPGIYLNAAVASHLIDRWLVAREAHANANANAADANVAQAQVPA